MLQFGQLSLVEGFTTWLLEDHVEATWSVVIWKASNGRPARSQDQQ
jgi:hypothetical protein